MGGRGEGEEGKLDAKVVDLSRKMYFRNSTVESASVMI